MRAQEVYEKIVQGKPEGLTTHIPQQNVIQNVQGLRNSLEILSGIPGFSEFDNFFKTSIVFKTTAPQLNINPPEWSQLAGQINLFASRLIGLRGYLQSVLQNQNQKAVYVKLPDSSDFAEVIQYQNRILKCFEQVILSPEIKGQISITSWEGGSLWIELSLGSEAAVMIIGSVAWAAAVVYKKVQEGRMFAEYVKDLKLKTEYLDGLVDAQKEMLKILVDTEARNIALQQIKNAEVPADTIERIKFSIKELSELIEKGAEIHPALQAPETVKNLFPNFKQLGNIESKTKLLEQANPVKA